MPSYRPIVSVEHAEISYGDAVYPPGGTFGPWLQPVLELLILFEGEMTSWVDGEPLHAGAETIWLLLQGHEVRLAFAKDRESHCGWIQYSALSGDQALLDHCAVLPKVLPLSQGLRRHTRSLLELATSRLPTRYQLEVHAGMQLLYQYIGEAERSSRELSSHLELALACIDDRLHLPLDLDAISSAAATSKAQLIRTFHKHLETTPMDYIWTRRTERGIELLQNTGLSVDQVAKRCGFRTSQHFSRRIKGATGLSPTDVRARAWRALEHKT
jgi:AraC family transcriptional regulator of arabinose operon